MLPISNWHSKPESWNFISISECVSQGTEEQKSRVIIGEHSPSLAHWFMTPKSLPFSKLPFKHLPFSSCFRTLKTSVWTKEFQVIIVGIQSFLSYPTLLAKPAPAMNIRAVSGRGSISSLSPSSYFFSRKTLLWLWGRWKSASGILIWNAFSHRNYFRWLFRRRQWNTWSSHFSCIIRLLWPTRVL